MAGRPGFFGGGNQTGAQDRDGDLGFGPDGLIGDSPFIRLGDPDGRPRNGFETPPGFDPVWGTLGAPVHTSDDFGAGGQEEAENGLAVDVDIFGAGFQISGYIRTGRFDRLSDWINMQTGFIAVRDAWHVHLGQTHSQNPAQRKGTLWVRLDQVVLMAERAPVQGNRPGAPVVQKQKRKVSIVTPGYNLIGNIFVHSYGSMTQFLETPDPHFLPMTDLTVHWLSDEAMVARFPFAMINREQLVTVLDEASTEGGDMGRNQDEGQNEDAMPLRRRWGAA